MIEPLTKISIPDRLAFPGQWRAGTGQKQIFILTEVFRNTKCEENLFEVARKLVRYGGLRLIAVEGHYQMIGDDYLQDFRGKGIEYLTNYADVSGGVLYLKMTSDPDVELWGVDHPELRPAQQQVQQYLAALELERKEIFGYLRSRITEAKMRLYSSELRQLDKVLSLNREDRPNLKEHVSTLVRFAKHRDLGFNGYPNLAKLIKCFEMEDEIDFPLAERQKERLISALMDKAYGWFALTGERNLRFDLEKLEPIAVLWLKERGRTLQWLETQIGERGIETVLLECRDWLDKWLLGGALKFWHGIMPGSDYYEDLLMLAISLKVGFSRFRELLKYAKYYQQAASLDRNLLIEELDGFTEFLMNKASTVEHRKVFDIETKTETLYRGYGCQLTPSEVKSLNRAISAFSSIAALRDEIARIGINGPGTITISSEFELGREQAFQYYNLSIARGQFMLENTFKLMKEMSDDRAIIVCGGFHVDVITQHLKEKYNEVAWSVISPNPDLSSLQNPHQESNGVK